MYFLSAPAACRLLLAGLLTTLPLLPVAAQQKPAPKKAPAKTSPLPKPAEPVYEQYQLQIRPEYAEGQFALQQYLKSVRLPAEVLEGRVQGLVNVGFVVQPDGRLTDAFVARGLSAATNAEALRLVRAMPPWRPGRRDDKPIASRNALSIVFQKPVAAAPAQAPDLVGLNEPSVREEVASSDKVYTYVEQMPQFPGGMEALQAYISQQLRYPAQAVRNQVEGRVFVSLVVQTDGRISNAKVIKGIGAGCDEEAVRVVNSLPAWAPGKQNGRAVSVQYTVPITFHLNTSPAGAGTEAALPPPVEDKVYTYVEQMPTLSNSTAYSSIALALQAALQLPEEVREGRTEGATYISLVVRADGSVTDAKVTRSLCTACDAAALAAVRALPPLAPGKQNGRPVSVQLTLPLTMYGPNHVFEGGQVSTPASFPGGGPALRHYLTDKLREPKVLKQENLSGAVEVRFVVQADGKIGAAEIVRPLCRSCDEEALRLVRDMPRWTPARNAASQPVAVRQHVLIPMPVTPTRGRTGSYWRRQPPAVAHHPVR